MSYFEPFSGICRKRSSSLVFKGILRTRVNMFRFAKAALNVSGKGARHVRFSSTHAPEFHAKYGTGLMVGGVAFCVSVWGFVLTQTGITWNLSPVGKVQPKPWRDAEE